MYAYQSINLTVPLGTLRRIPCNISFHSSAKLIKLCSRADSSLETPWEESRLGVRGFLSNSRDMKVSMLWTCQVFVINYLNMYIFCHRKGLIKMGIFWKELQLAFLPDFDIWLNGLHRSTKPGSKGSMQSSSADYMSFQKFSPLLWLYQWIHLPTNTESLPTLCAAGLIYHWTWSENNSCAML